ncbi:MAG: CAF17-like 4Fe-4S cluster assembly/insertion protein YgfZ [Pseudomonadales bacterium]
MESFFTLLDYQDLLQINGKDSEKFLQGQLTCDLENIPPWQCQLGAVCNTKGRVYSSFRLLRTDIPFYKAEMADASQHFKRFGLVGQQAQEAIGKCVSGLPEPNQALEVNGDILVNLGGDIPRFEVWLNQEQGPLADVCTELNQEDKSAWQALDLEKGILIINQKDAEQYTPEELNMDLAGFVSWDKGCYTGQEIVARMHYRGKAGKRLYKVSFKQAGKINETTLKNSSGNTLGIIFNILYLNDNIIESTAVLKTNIDLEEPIYLTAKGEQLPVSVTPLF